MKVVKNDMPRNKTKKDGNDKEKEARMDTCLVWSLVDPNHHGLVNFMN